MTFAMNISGDSYKAAYVYVIAAATANKTMSEFSPTVVVIYDGGYISGLMAKDNDEVIYYDKVSDWAVNKSLEATKSEDREENEELVSQIIEDMATFLAPFVYENR